MTTLQNLTAAIDAFLDGDDSANVTLVPREAGPDMALIRADALEALKARVADLETRAGMGNEDTDRDAFSLLDEQTPFTP